MLVAVVPAQTGAAIVDDDSQELSYELLTLASKHQMEPVPAGADLTTGSSLSAALKASAIPGTPCLPA